MTKGVGIIGVAMATILACMLSGCGVDGYHTANPTTILRFDPTTKAMHFQDSKDNDVAIKDLSWQGDTKSFKVAEVQIQNNASKVREANVQQLQMLSLQTQAIMLGLQNVASAMSAIVPGAKTPTMATGMSLTIPTLTGAPVEASPPPPTVAAPTATTKPAATTQPATTSPPASEESPPKTDSASGTASGTAVTKVVDEPPPAAATTEPSTEPAP